MLVAVPVSSTNTNCAGSRLDCLALERPRISYVGAILLGRPHAFF
jgi:hypothetical protein